MQLCLQKLDFFENNSNNEKNFKPEVWKIGDAVLFHDKLVHRGPINYSSKLRTSIEFTILIIKEK